MQLERQFAGPLRDTLIQRWRDPVDGTICYVYLPILGAHSAPTASGYVEYGANTIGSISCSLAPAAAPPARNSAPTTRPRLRQPPGRPYNNEQTGTSERVCESLKGVVLGPARRYERQMSPGNGEFFQC